ncbi:MAG: YabP/YqfC family sporulation protein [Clostridia bacterium]|nr:YabP/YqfC family sporulation protein [Clostridia bacterium]
MPKAQRKNRFRLSEMIAGLTGFPAESLTDIPVLLCKGTQEIQVEGCRSILEYSGERIRMHMGRETLLVEGEELHMADFHRNCLSIRGRIAGIRWEV